MLGDYNYGLTMQGSSTATYLLWYIFIIVVVMFFAWIKREHFRHRSMLWYATCKVFSYVVVFMYPPSFKKAVIRKNSLMFEALAALNFLFVVLAIAEVEWAFIMCLIMPFIHLMAVYVYKEYAQLTVRRAYKVDNTMSTRIEIVKVKDEDRADEKNSQGTGN
jgi:hypothetical protein